MKKHCQNRLNLCCSFNSSSNLQKRFNQHVCLLQKLLWSYFSFHTKNCVWKAVGCLNSAQWGSNTTTASSSSPNLCAAQDLLEMKRCGTGTCRGNTSFELTRPCPVAVCLSSPAYPDHAQTQRSNPCLQRGGALPMARRTPLVHRSLASQPLLHHKLFQLVSQTLQMGFRGGSKLSLVFSCSPLLTVTSLVSWDG